ncbi:outer membrane protein assembly factor BamD [bacterium endosymbiont of Pedicinus badii]|uniref:outer membrane protein assembly factor BamD n=1 Tax=bacterium endosymbiont of Pedicinus badii TaxID=1719126 RepID=UPI0009BB7C7B|nr:outer membrane protein assembly factor BamD [bacterium endosymbiont of Pedicinus badii]OQM34253.1 hypothetical protein AOQ89_02900 [bacterium endosymbiont of Pedicinus badii]
MIIKKFFTKSVLYFFLFFCFSSLSLDENQKEEKKFIQKNYKFIKYLIQKKKYKKAIFYIRNKFNIDPIFPTSKKFRVILVYLHYKNSDFISTKKSCEEFIKFYPESEYTDYILYMKGLSNIQMQKKNSQSFFQIYKNDCDNSYFKIAFSNFSQVSFNKKGKYFKNSIKILHFLKEKIAKKELLIVKYYFKIFADVAVIKRSEQILKNFPSTQSAYKCLFYMKKSYKRLKLKDQKNKIEKIIYNNRVN